MHKQDSKSAPPRPKPSVHFVEAALVGNMRVEPGIESDPGYETRLPSPSPRTGKPLHVRIREAFTHLTHHHHDLSSSASSEHAEFKQPHLKSPTNPASASTSSTSVTSVPSASTSAPIAIPAPRKHRSFWSGLFGRRLEREEIVPESPARSAGARSVIKIDETAIKLLQETVPEFSEPSDVTFSTKYRFINSKVIGKGSSGVVRLACRKEITDAQLNSDNLFAVKEFRRRKRDESQHEYLRKITAEYCIATTLHHDNVIETVDIVHDKERWYEVMEYCPGGDLFNAIAHGGLDDEQIDSCFRELAYGVSYLHSLGVAHRDLKPENILVDQFGHCRITDFGVSDVFKVVWERLPHKSRGLCGSSPYIAPEEYGGQEYDAQKVDVWSLGIIYYAMTFHSVPWEEATENDPNYAEYVRKGVDNFEPFQRMPAHSRQVLKGMLQIDPNARLGIEDVKNSAWLQRVVSIPLPVYPAIVINNGASHSQSSNSD